MNNLSTQESGLKDKFGTANVKVLSQIRRAIQNQNKEQLDYLRNRFPKAVAVAEQEIAGAGRGAAGGGDTTTAPKAKTPIAIAFTSFEDAIRSIQTSLQTDDKSREQKKQTSFLGSIDSGIQKLTESIGDQAVVGV